MSPLGIQKGRRLAYRVDLRDGATIKVREYENEDAARSAFELNAALGRVFAGALARYGRVVVEEWIEGAPLAPDDEHRTIEEAGEILGRLHASFPQSSSGRVGTGRWRREAVVDLDLLLQAGCVQRDDADRLLGIVDETDPGEACTTVIHLDFCAENMVRDGGGALRVVDNELLCIGPRGLDLGRTFHRWPFAAANWSGFLAGYLLHAGDPGAAPFWRIVAALLGARVFLQRCPERLPTAIEHLQSLAREDRTASSRPMFNPLDTGGR
ncbi:MAG: aminoglycoside phosphotransferase family protein [Gammaproteobacteria bacterium]|nr:aminoglycoside phosphotransferase family protein [Gammaproteobacteria bacterium]